MLKISRFIIILLFIMIPFNFVFAEEQPDTKSIVQSKNNYKTDLDNFLSIPWNSSWTEARNIMFARPNTLNTRYYSFDKVNYKKNMDLWDRYITTFSEYFAIVDLNITGTLKNLTFVNANVFIPQSEDNIVNLLNVVSKALTIKYGTPAIIEDGSFDKTKTKIKWYLTCQGHPASIELNIIYADFYTDNIEKYTDKISDNIGNLKKGLLIKYKSNDITAIKITPNEF